MVSVNYESRQDLTTNEKNIISEFNHLYEFWSENRVTYLEHLNKTLHILDFIRIDISKNKALYSSCDKATMVFHDDSKYFLGDLMNEIMSDPLSSFEESDFMPSIGIHRDDIKSKKNDIECLRELVTMNNDYRYYFIDNDDVEFIGSILN